MKANRISEIPSDSAVLDAATLYLCRQGKTWVVVVESPRYTGAILLRHAGPDSFDARFELLSRTRHARPDAAIVTTDGVTNGADYEWRVEVHGLEDSPGDLGVALQRELSDKRQRHQRRLATRQAARTCHAGWFSSFSSFSSTSSSGRPLSF
jgi:hypothetical protein